MNNGEKNNVVKDAEVKGLIEKPNILKLKTWLIILKIIQFVKYLLKKV